jgi:hypothetical protein
MMPDSGFQVITHPGYISFWGDEDPWPGGRADWDFAYEMEEAMIEQLDKDKKKKGGKTT